MIALRNISDAAARMSAKQSTRLTRLREDSPLRSSCHRTKSVRMLAGMLPLASRITAGPVDAPRPAVRHAATSLGGSGVEEIGADRRRWVDAEQQDKQRSHQ